MKHFLLTLTLVISSLSLFSQKYLTQSGVISFYSEAPLENIESTNNQVSSVINIENGQMVFSLLMKAFVFEKALMQTHFNEKYVESETFPKASFKGKIKDFNNLEISTKPQTVTVEGTLTIHGESREVAESGEIFFNASGELVANSTFNIKLDDYKIKIPASVKENISNTVELKISMQYEKMD